MSRIIDISTKLNNAKPKVKITDDLTVTVNNTKSAVLIAQQNFNKETDEEVLVTIDDTLRILIGKDALEQLNELDPPFEFYQEVFTAVMAAATGDELDDVEERFPEQEAK